MIKLIWQNIPKNLKKLLIPSAFIFPLLIAGLYQYLSEGKLKYSETALINFLFFFLIYLVIIILISVFISYSKIIYKIHQIVLQLDIKSNGTTSESPVKIKRKSLPNRFELEVKNYDNIEYTVLIWRKWLPTEEKPGIEEFLRAIDFSQDRCGKCHSDFFVKSEGYHHWSLCSNSKCENNKQIYARDLDEFRTKTFFQYKGDVRSDYSKYWDSYKNIYNRYTKKNYEEYENPV